VDIQNRLSNQELMRSRAYRLASLWGGAALTGAALAAAAAAFGSDRPIFPSPAKPGLRSYDYNVVETVNGHIEKAYRVSFDLENDKQGAVDVIVRSAEESTDAKAWTSVAVGESCKTAMNAPSGGVARAHLWPLDAATAKNMGAQFLDTCAPGGVFFPLTDILNVVIIPLSPTFNVAKLRHAGDSIHYDGYEANYDRNGEKLKQTAHGGEVSLISLGKIAVVDWSPAVADLDLIESAGAQPVHLKGTEHFAFRVTLDTKTGALIEAHTTYDDLDLAAHLPGMPEDQTAPVKINRTVTIRSR
jgi:hypothetical protein